MTFFKNILLITLLSYNFLAQHKIIATIQPPGQCPSYPALESIEKQVSLSYIRELATGIYNEFAEPDSPCFRLVSVRMYGALQLSPELVDRCLNKTIK